MEIPQRTMLVEAACSKLCQKRGREKVRTTWPEECRKSPENAGYKESKRGDEVDTRLIEAKPGHGKQFLCTLARGWMERCMQTSHLGGHAPVRWVRARVRVGKATWIWTQTARSDSRNSGPTSVETYTWARGPNKRFGYVRERRWGC